MNFHFEFFSKNISNKQFTYKDVDISLFQRPVPRTTTLDNQKKKKNPKIYRNSTYKLRVVSAQKRASNSNNFQLISRNKDNKNERKKKESRKSVESAETSNQFFARKQKWRMQHMLSVHSRATLLQHIHINNHTCKCVWWDV